MEKLVKKNVGKIERRAMQLRDDDGDGKKNGRICSNLKYCEILNTQQQGELPS